MSEKYELSAFPRYFIDETGAGAIDGGMTLRDYFAIHASEEDLEKYLPETVTDAKNKLLTAGIIPPDRVKVDAFRSYNSNEYRKLRSLARYQFADDMIETRNNR